MIRTSKENKTVVQNLTRKLGLGFENQIARIAFAHSISNGNEFHTSEIKDSSGKEYSDTVFFGDKITIYKGIISLKYNLHPENPDVLKLIKIHIDDGLSLIDQLYSENNSIDVFSDLIQLS